MSFDRQALRVQLKENTSLPAKYSDFKAAFSVRLI